MRISPSSAGTPERRIEDWYKNRGLSSFLRGTPYRTDVSRRAAPFLVACFILVMLVDNVSWGLPLSLMGTLLSWVGANVARQRPPFAMVQRIGWIESAVFILVPTLATLITPPRTYEVELIAHALEDYHLSERTVNFLATYGGLTGTFLLQVFLLLTALAFVRLGLVAISTWLLRELWSSLENAGAALSRALPLLVIITVFAYFTAELWQTLGRLKAPGYMAVILLFLIAGAAFILKGQSDGLATLASFSDTHDIEANLAHTPLVGRKVAPTTPLVCELDRSQRRSARVVIAVSRLVLSTVIGVFTAIFFVILGFITVSQADVVAFSTGPAEAIWGFTLDERRFVLSWQHIRVAGFLGIFSAFYFAVVSATDERLRDQLLGTAEDGVREACALRLALLHTPAITGTNPLGNSDSAAPRRHEERSATDHAAPPSGASPTGHTPDQTT